MDPEPNELPEMDFDETLAQVPVVQAAWEFLQALYDGDLQGAWQLMDPTLRLCWAQGWVHHNDSKLRASGYDPDELITALVDDADAGHEWWESFSAATIRDFHQAIPLDVEAAGIGSTPRAMAMDVEVLYVHPTPPQGSLWKEGEARAVFPLVMRFANEKWGVLNWGFEAIPTPGYPPILTGEA